MIASGNLPPKISHDSLSSPSSSGRDLQLPETMLDMPAETNGEVDLSSQGPPTPITIENPVLSRSNIIETATEAVGKLNLSDGAPASTPVSRPVSGPSTPIKEPHNGEPSNPGPSLPVIAPATLPPTVSPRHAKFKPVLEAPNVDMGAFLLCCSLALLVTNLFYQTP